ncbi:hypothetical protein V6N13_071999 [Hibiscus sabdariffa]
MADVLVSSLVKTIFGTLNSLALREYEIAIIESIDGSCSVIESLDPLQRCLQEKLRGKRFLLILDDVWNENYEKWECFRNPLKVGAQDSVVMVSTRIEKVALNMATLPIYHLDYLSDNNSWLLFKHHSFLMESKEEYLFVSAVTHSWWHWSDGIQFFFFETCESIGRRLPQSTSCLQKLRIMKIFACRCLRELPQGMKHMISLKCVDISHCDSLERTPPGIGYLTQLLELSIFIVRKEHGCGIEELKELELRKELSLKDLDNVTGSTEAKSANLIRKPKLRSLRLIWGKNAGEHPDNEEEVLGSLQPHSNLEDLRISCYHGLRLPHWWMDLPNLVLVELDQCKRCSHLPPLGELPVLKFLKIRGMDAVKCISNEFYGNGVNPFSSLEKLYFDSMPSLEKWKTVDRGGDFPRLQFLSFRKCPELIELPKFPTLKKLRISTRNNDFVIDNPDLGSLEIHALSSLTFFPSGLLQNHTYLEELTISSLPNLKSLSNKLDHLSMLKHLSIDSCNNVEDIPEAVQNLIALESLFLSECHSLVSFPGNGFHCLPSVRVLTIMSCERFVSLSDAVRHLTHLEELSLVGCPVLNSLPAEIQHLNALQKLEFSWCDGLTTVPNHIEHLTSLSELTFSFCHNLMSLNQSLKSLATLKELTIWGCPHLENRCKKEGGEDWPYIAHIPSIRIMPLDDLPYYGKRRSHGSFLKRFGDWTYGLSRQLLKYKSDS